MDFDLKKVQEIFEIQTLNDLQLALKKQHFVKILATHFSENLKRF